MIRISGYIISLSLLILYPAMAQTEPAVITDVMLTDTTDITPGRRIDTSGVPAGMPAESMSDSVAEQADGSFEQGFRIGINLSEPLFMVYEPSKLSVEMVFDRNIGTEYFAVAETGFAMRELNEPAYRLEEKGLFMRFGGDKNFLKQFNDVVALGARLGFSVYERSAPLVIVEGGYWGDYSGSLAAETFFRQWAEVVLVLKTEIFNNVFLGWNLRGKVLLFGREDSHMDERYIPGFGTGEVNSTLGFDFYIYYRFPTGRMNQKGN